MLGRDPSCDVVLDDGRVSRRHAELSLQKGHSSITDLGSKNGIAVDGRAVPRAELGEACWISVGGLLVQFESGARAVAADRTRRDATLERHRHLAQPGLEVRELVDRLLASVLEMSATDRGFLLLARDTARFEVVASRGLSPEVVGGSEFSGSASTVREVLAAGEPLVKSDALSGGPGASPSVVEGGIRALVCLPLKAAGRLLGVVYTDSRRPGKTFDELDLEILTALASHAALAMWAAGLREELEGLVRGLPTRIDRAAGATPPLPGFPTWSIGLDPSLSREPV